MKQTLDTYVARFDEQKGATLAARRAEYAALVNNGGSRYIPGQPRNALLTANLKF